ncbi:MAG: MFS transporter [Cyanobacteria bacterium]|nr:MFS transporter [Cyanobacteriota bacterium]
MLSLFTELAPSVRRNLLLLFGAALLFWASMSSLLPTLSVYVQKIGGDDREVGIVMGSFAVGLLLLRPQMGRWADSRGRKFVLILGAIAAALAPLGYLSTRSIPLLMALRVFHGLSIAAFTTGYSAFVVDLSPPQRKGELIGYMTLTQPLGVAIGPALGSYLQTYFGDLPNFLVASSFGLAALLGITTIREPKRDAIAPDPSPPEAAIADGQNSPPVREAFWTRIAAAPYRVPATVMLAIGLVFGTLSTFIPLYILASGVDLIPGLFYTVAAIASFSARLLTGRQADRIGRGPFISLSLVFYVLAMGRLATATTAVDFLWAGLLEGLAGGLLIPMMVALVSDRAAPEERGRTFALVLLGFDLGIALAGPVLGGLTGAIGYGGLFAIAAGLSLLALGLFMTTSSATLRSSLRFAIGRAPDVYALGGR